MKIERQRSNPGRSPAALMYARNGNRTRTLSTENWILLTATTFVATTAVWCLWSGLYLHPTTPRYDWWGRCSPSSLYTFPDTAGAWLGIGINVAAEAFTEFDEFYSGISCRATLMFLPPYINGGLNDVSQLPIKATNSERDENLSPARLPVPPSGRSKFKGNTGQRLLKALPIITAAGDQRS